MFEVLENPIIKHIHTEKLASILNNFFHGVQGLPCWKYDWYEMLISVMLLSMLM